MKPLTLATMALGLSVAVAHGLEVEKAGHDSGGPLEAPSQSSVVETSGRYDGVEEMTLAFIFHVDDGLAEQDVFYEKVPGSGEVWRPTAATREMDAPLYRPASPVEHSPLDVENTGPWPKGEPLGITLGEWFAAKGEGVYRCEGGVGDIRVAFRGLVPNGVYTMWHDFGVWPPTDPFPGFYDIPFGARDGSDNAFVADANGDALFERSITPCLQLSGEQLITDIAIAWHSDGETHGGSAGEFSTRTHVQIYVTLPQRAGL